MHPIAPPHIVEAHGFRIQALRQSQLLSNVPVYLQQNHNEHPCKENYLRRGRYHYKSSLTQGEHWDRQY